MSSYEYHQILQFLYFEGYADSYESAECLLESLDDDEYDELNEARRKLAHSFPLKPSERRSAANIERMNRGDFSVPPDESVRVRSSKKAKPEPEAEPEEQKPRRRRRTDMSKVIVAHYLFDEGYAETIESAELIAESISEEWARQILDEANKWEKKSGIGGKSPESELSRTRSRAFHTGGVGSKGSKNTVNPSDIDSGTLLMNRGVARKVHKRNRGKSPSDPTYTHRKKIDPLKIPSYRESPLGLPKGYKEPFKSRSKVGDKVNANIKPLQTKDSVDAKSNIRKFKREDLEYILDTLISEGFAVDYDSAGCILESMSDEWIGSLLDEKYVKAMNPRGADRRARTTDPTVRPSRLKPMPPEIKYTESGFDKTASRRSPSARRRKGERRQGTGGFDV